jgi:hypothetical protein
MLQHGRFWRRYHLTKVRAFGGWWFGGLLAGMSRAGRADVPRRRSSTDDEVGPPQRNIVYPARLLGNVMIAVGGIAGALRVSRGGSTLIMPASSRCRSAWRQAQNPRACVVVVHHAATPRIDRRERRGDHGLTVSKMDVPRPRVSVSRDIPASNRLPRPSASSARSRLGRARKKRELS